MKKSACILFTALLWIGLHIQIAFSGSYKGEVLDIFGNNIVTVKVAGGHTYKPDDQVDLTHMAGAMPMSLGIYKVTMVDGDTFLCRSDNMVMEPRAGMRIQIDLLKKAPKAGQPAMGKRRQPFGPDVSGAGRDLQRYDHKHQADPFKKAAQKKTIPVYGVVSKVKGNSIEINLPHGTMAKIRKGQTIVLSFFNSSGHERYAGKWKVAAAAGDKVRGVPWEPLGDPMVGYRAVILVVQ